MGKACSNGEGGGLLVLMCLKVCGAHQLQVTVPFFGGSHVTSGNRDANSRSHVARTLRRPPRRSQVMRLDGRYPPRCVRIDDESNVTSRGNQTGLTPSCERIKAISPPSPRNHAWTGRCAWGIHRARRPRVRDHMAQEKDASMSCSLWSS